MSISNDHLHRISAIVAIALISTVVTQVLYMAFLGGPQPADPAVGMTNADIARYFTDRWQEVATIWTIEAVAFMTIAIGALTALPGGRRRLGWAALAVAGVFNLVQIGIGLSLFKPIALAGEAHTWMFWAFVGGAFAFYFIAKIAVGVAAAAFGFGLMREAHGMMGRVTGGLALLAGVAAAVVNVAALGAGMGWLMIAGGTGTLAALLLAVALIAHGRTHTN
ncbi:hypothetical protein [Aurantiacibacter sp. D1-12]|uniref:hypothetical protein n=1 Tax=Aurantiacibacter sp. D1-12 TaxID=2993658 RepID=UPI00237CE329|nr:hypothetical protein [Aurantiacibacter sp. D1-12]MDE1467674.1 hypothetical protein [Aurantiacibacter sp. D1-12]